jgi:hypothetical protein
MDDGTDGSLDEKSITKKDHDVLYIYKCSLQEVLLAQAKNGDELFQ